MRSIGDRRLPEPYRSWIDGRRPLPGDVLLLPRTVDFTLDTLRFAGLAVPMGAMAVFFASLATRIRPAEDGWLPLLFIASVAAALCIPPVVMFRRALVTLGAKRDLERGALRQGVFIGPDGMLVRLESNRCHAIPAERFVVAKRFPPDKSRDSRAPTVTVETLDGAITFFASRLDAHPERINQAASAAWPSWTRPKPPMRSNRKRKDDTKRWHWFVRFKLYRCPRCAARLPQAYEALPAVHFYCGACNVEWNTGLTERHAGMD